MATDGVRRSGRARKAVTTYADEQAEDILATKVPVSKSTKAPKVTKQKPSPGDGESAVLSDSPEPPAKRTKTAKQADKDDATFDTSDTSSPVAKKASKKSKTKRKKGDPPPLDEQVRQGFHSKIYPQTKKITLQEKGWHGEAAEFRIERARSKTQPLLPGQQEKRLRSFVEVPGDEYETFLHRATTQKMFVLNRERFFEDDCHAGHDDCPSEVLKMAGSRGDVYTITISHLLSCSCPVALFTRDGKQRCCKHLIYVLHNVLEAPDRLKYQNAFLTSELREIFDNAPPLPSEIGDKVEDADAGNRKPLDDDCPICSLELEGEATVWCKTCGYSLHQVCFKQWAKVKARNVTCVFCRAEWQDDDGGGKQKVITQDVAISAQRSASGYQNVRHLLEQQYD
ncbi:hypothetical protein LTR78_008266 [Recurvomyces mirabilis]|uniref:Uncharacterized protein n=1 Tax=Recurvomyces mirabilis TaxID=574656 RepID=A0AAE0TQE5_9PEZI|nr:hypothetical protein LTR78_008266 [Recurvomyces mirabilis]KAK5156551.1 hypothetical protein LTS14_004763 [Recurvomyces mirabilis]